MPTLTYLPWLRSSTLTYLSNDARGKNMTCTGSHSLTKQPKYGKITRCDPGHFVSKVKSIRVNINRSSTARNNNV